MNVYVIMWLATFAIAFVVELSTASLVCVWFMPSALICAVLAAIGASTTIQITLFFLLSVSLLMLFRKKLEEYVQSRRESATSDIAPMLGSVGRVEEEIDNFRSKGSVVINGNSYPARSSDNGIIPVGAKVAVKKIHGEKIICRLVEKETKTRG
ncbi:MAG: hypothetical protein IJO52_03965 [Clostridia bacterium]|nr:hypothetical protein [Clostridia bacterium]